MVRGSTGTLEEIFFKTSRFDVSFCTNCFLMGSSVAVVSISNYFFGFIIRLWVYLLPRGCSLGREGWFIIGQ